MIKHGIQVILVLVVFVLSKQSSAQIQHIFWGCKLGETYSLIAEDILAYQIHPMFMNVMSVEDSVIDMIITINKKITIENCSWDKCILGFDKDSNKFYYVEFIKYDDVCDTDYYNLYEALNDKYKQYIVSQSNNSLIAEDDRYKLQLIFEDDKLRLIYNCRRV